MNSFKTWLTRHWIAVSAAVLLGLTLLLTVAAPLWKGSDDKLDPQAQIGVGWIKPAGSEAAYAGNEACRSCHPGEFQSYIASPHSRTVQAIPQGAERAEFASKQTVPDEYDGVNYSVQAGSGKNQVVATTGSTSVLGEARWVFGSGTHAWTYLSQEGPQFLQLRISYYPPDRTWNFTPGNGPGVAFHQALGDPYTPGQAAACFGCHSTILTGSRKRLDLTHSILNVGCESCHGPSRSHIESIRAAERVSTGTPHLQVATVKPALHDGPQIMQLCGACHRLPVAVSDQDAASEPQLARFPGQALPRSRCFIASAGKLSCITCHDPHQSARQQQEVSFNQKCLSCHTAPHGTVCARGKKTDCVTCHMPLEQIARKLPLRFHNHWIRKDPYGQGK